MEIIDPVALGDVACTRASVKWVWDRTGTLVSVPANTLAVTYDPSDLGKAPYAWVELVAATNSVRNNTMAGAAAGTPGALPTNWTSGGLTVNVVGGGVQNGIEYVDLQCTSASTVSGAQVAFDSDTAIVGAAGQAWAGSFFANLIAGSLAGVTTYANIQERTTAGAFLIETNTAFALPSGAMGSNRATVARTLDQASTGRVVTTFKLVSDGAFDFTVRIGLPQLELGSVATSPIKTSGAAVTRAADSVAPGAGVVFSNVPITALPYSPTGTFAKDVVVYDLTTYLTYTSQVAANTGNALTDTTKWLKGDVINRRKMLDQYNNTQTTNADEILLVVSPQAISQGAYLGNLDATEVRISVVDLTEGLISRDTTSLTVSNSGSSFFNWCFKRIKRQTYFITKSLPVYANALVTICIRKIGSTPKCGMCAVGPLDEFGPSLMGLSTEGKDYSTTTFNFDGTTNTVIRPYAKRMSVDVVIDNTDIDYIQERLFEYRQKPIVWIGGPYGSTAVFGRYGSFRNVIESFPRSKMALQIEGSV